MYNKKISTIMTLMFLFIMRSKKLNVFPRDDAILKICRVRPNGLSTYSICT